MTFAADEDINNEKLLVSYAGLPFKLQFNSQTPPVWTYYEQSALLTAEYEVSIVRAVVTVERDLPSLSEHHRVKMRTNASPWSGDPAETWLILGVDSSTNGSGGFDWKYQLAHAEDGRRRTVVGDSNGPGGGHVGERQACHVDGKIASIAPEMQFVAWVVPIHIGLINSAWWINVRRLAVLAGPITTIDRIPKWLRQAT